MNTMAIRLVFSFNREVLQFVVLDKEIFYSDRVWKNWVRIIPKDPSIKRKLIMSRNKFPKHIISMFDLSKKELEEYKNAKDDEELVEIIIKDACKRGCKFEGSK